MFMLNCQAWFEGGPHHGALVSLNQLPSEKLVVSADPSWRRLPIEEMLQPAKGLAAVYVRVGTRMTDGRADPPLVWRYRFLSYFTPYLSDGGINANARGHSVATV